MRVPGQIRREPVSAAIGLTDLIAGFLGTSAAVGGVASVIGGAIVGGAISVGLSFAATALLTKGAAGSLDSQPIGQSAYSTRQTVPPKRIIYGQAYVGGALFFEKVEPPFLYHGYLINQGEIESFDSIFIGTNEIKFAEIVPNTIMVPVNQPGQPDYAKNLRVCVRLGKSDQLPDPILAQDFPNLGPNFRQRGIATVVLRYEFGEDGDDFVSLWGNNPYPIAYFLVKGRKIYIHGKPGHVMDDPTTWEWNNIAANVQADYMRASFGGRISSDKIDWDKVKESADYDGGLIGTLAGDNIPRHTVDGLITLDQPPDRVLGGMLTANRGFMLQEGGKMWPSSSIPTDPILTITDDLLVGGIQYQAGKPKRDLVNSVKTRFISKEQSYVLVDGPSLTRDDLVAEDQELLEVSLSLPFTLDYRRVERLQKAFLDSSRLGRTLTVSVAIRALAITKDRLIGAAVRLDSRLFPQASGIYQITNTSFAEGMSSISITCAEYDKTIESSFIPEVDEIPFVEPAIDLS